ncbi:MAG TPA: ATP-binding protein [Thermomicrobiales bacterium]|nr:ATP-binding protein [Thermomicrobiales bacterium]
MTDDEFQAIVERGRESRNVEFKSGGPINDNHLLRRVLRAVLAMSNSQRGGFVILGVEERAGQTILTGLPKVDASTWTLDDFSDKCADWVDPAISVDIEIKHFREKDFVVIDVSEFDETPVFARKGYRSPAGDMVLRAGALYVRGTRKPETVEIRTAEDMRRLLSLALEKRVAHFFRLATVAGFMPQPSALPSDEDLFEQQAQDFSP